MSSALYLGYLPTYLGHLRYLPGVDARLVLVGRSRPPLPHEKMLSPRR